MPAASAPYVIAMKLEIAIVRTLADELERWVVDDTARSIRRQLSDELARLGHRCLEVAAAMTGQNGEGQMGSPV